MSSTPGSLFSMPRLRAVSLHFGAFCFLIRCISSAHGAENMALPQTRLGQTMQLLLEAVDGDSEQARMSFVSNHVGVATDKRAECVKMLDHLHEQSGGLRLISVNNVSSNATALTVRSLKGDHWATIGTSELDDNSGKIWGLGIIPGTDPENAAAEAWPKQLDLSSFVHEIDRHARQLLAEDRFAGVILVAEGDDILFEKAYGLQDRKAGIPNTLATKFNDGSMNKMFTAVAIAQLVEGGRLSFDDSVAKVLPEYPNKEVAAKVTIHQLLTHSAGLGELFDKPFDRRKNYLKSADYFPIFAGSPLLFEPGHGWRYSNEGYIVLGAIIEKISGQSYDAYLKEHVFGPAGMNESGDFSADEMPGTRAIGYMRDSNDDPLGIDPPRDNGELVGTRGNACGGAYVTAGDWLKFARALQTGKLIRHDMFIKLTTPRAVNWYGYGFFVNTIGDVHMAGHTGGGPHSGIDCDFEMIGEKTVIVLGNYDAPYAEQLARDICEALVKLPPAKPH
jgi:CubicO group peptidase (beta-lactamase class C family)